MTRQYTIQVEVEITAEDERMGSYVATHTANMIKTLCDASTVWQTRTFGEGRCETNVRPPVRVEWFQGVACPVRTVP